MECHNGDLVGLYSSSRMSRYAYTNSMKNRVMHTCPVLSPNPKVKARSPYCCWRRNCELNNILRIWAFIYTKYMELSHISSETRKIEHISNGEIGFQKPTRNSFTGLLYSSLSTSSYIGATSVLYVGPRIVEKTSVYSLLTVSNETIWASWMVSVSGCATSIDLIGS